MAMPTIGTDDWIQFVRSTPPVRNPIGRSRPTEQFFPYSEALKRNMGIEGGNELTGMLLLEALHAAGLVRWFKEQPFELNEPEHGIEATPDFIFEWCDGKRFVAETKSSAYVTADVLDRTARLTALLGKVEIDYLLWTDKIHLRKPLWTNVRRIWSERGAYYSTEEVEIVMKAICDGPRTLGYLVEHGANSDTALHLAGKGRAHFNLTEHWNARTIISDRPEKSHYGLHLGAKHDPEAWWNSLQSLANPE
jgi:hypothetical protein